MIDWLWMRVKCEQAATLKTPRIAAISADGEVEWECPRWLQSRGSHDSKMAVRPHGGLLEISGSPAKFLQGHNCFGSDDAHALGVFVIGQVCDALNLGMTNTELEAVIAGDVELVRVDVNYSFSTGSRANALAWIRAAEQHGHLQHRGRGMMNGASVYWGRKSRQWEMLSYCKGQELADPKHAPPKDLLYRAELLAWADDKLRIEQRFHARGLRDLGLDRLSSWKCSTARDIFEVHRKKLTLSGELTMTEVELSKMRPALRTALGMWKSGTDLRPILSRNTFYRYRRQLLDLAGVDIAVAPVNERSNVVPLVRYIEAVPAEAPAWAHGTSLLWTPPERRRA